MPPTPELESRIAGIAALDQPMRRDLYRLLAEADRWMTRDEAAAALGVARSVAAFHLDKLVDAGVLEVRYQRTGGRRGPGAGRPAKLYRPGAGEVAASVPERHYDLAASLLAEAVAESTRTGMPVDACLHAAARAAGRQIGEEAATALHAEEPGRGQQAVLDVLAHHGYEPRIERQEVALANCPFHRLAEQQRTLVCGMNLDFLDGLLEGMSSTDRLAARLDPAPGFCCVRIAPA